MLTDKQKEELKFKYALQKKVAGLFEVMGIDRQSARVTITIAQGDFFHIDPKLDKYQYVYDLDWRNKLLTDMSGFEEEEEEEGHAE